MKHTPVSAYRGDTKLCNELRVTKEQHEAVNSL